MNILEKIDLDIKNFAEKIQAGEGWIARDDIFRQFTSLFDDYDNQIFNQIFSQEGLTAYISEVLQIVYGIDVEE
jgi:succinate dehydrogenase flavin-adding protein (antitoxin of CptAB toxin-antitoxin module)